MLSYRVCSAVVVYSIVIRHDRRRTDCAKRLTCPTARRGNSEPPEADPAAWGRSWYGADAAGRGDDQTREYRKRAQQSTPTYYTHLFFI